VLHGYIVTEVGQAVKKVAKTVGRGPEPPLILVGLTGSCACAVWVFTVNAAVAVVVLTVGACRITAFLRCTERLGSIACAAHALAAPVGTVGEAIAVVVFAVGTELCAVFCRLLAADGDVLISRTVEVATVGVTVAIVVDAVRAGCVVIFWIAWTANRYIFVA
jgi:hypothetical protein